MSSLSDPPESSVIAAAAQWGQTLITGDLATILAVVAIAVVGLGMLGGRIDVRRGARVLLGCFILFGAASIAQGLQNAASADDAAPPVAEPAPPPTYILPPRTDAANPSYDPYAGASVPQN